MVNGVADCNAEFSYSFSVAERPQHMLMRVSVGIHGNNIPAVLETYNLLSEKWFTHASPTLFNAGTCHPQLSSCFLLTMKEDSIEVGGTNQHVLWDKLLYVVLPFL